MPLGLVLGLALVSLVLGVLAVADLAAGAARNRAMVERTALDVVEARAGRWDVRLDLALRRTRLGAFTSGRLSRSGVEQRVVTVLGVGLAAALVVLLVVSSLVPPVLAVVLAVLASYTPFLYLRRKQDQRGEVFIAQLPELARVLSNAASAGLALRSAITLAGEDLAEPAGGELRRVTDALGVGTSLQEALRDLEGRLPSRELAVLVSTLVISSRSGGSVVTALRTIATTLDARKELRREVRTQLAQAVASSYLVLGIGVAILVGASLVSPGIINTMLAAGPGRVALLTATVLFTVGFLLVRRITRVRT